MSINQQQQQQQQNNENKYLTNNRYNNRNVLKTNTLQPQPQRISRALSERPQNIVGGGGYDTDTGVLGYNHQQSMMYRSNYRRNHNDSDTESLRVPSQARYTPDLNRRYIGDHSGYDTDTGLINARKSLNERLISTNSNKLRSNSNLEKDPLFMKNSSTKLDNNNSVVNINSNFKYNGSTSSTPTKQLFRLSNENSQDNKNNTAILNDSNEDKKKSAFHSISSIKNIANQDYNLQNQKK